MTTDALKPLEVYLREDQLEDLQALAEREGVSVGDLVRRSVDVLLTTLPAIQRPSEVPPDDDAMWGIVGIFNSGLGDLAAEHDRYLAELIEEENRPWPTQSS